MSTSDTFSQASVDAFDPLANDKKPQPLPIDLIPRIAQRMLGTFSGKSKIDLPTYDKILFSALKTGLAKPEGLAEQGWKRHQNPPPHIAHQVLVYISTLKPEEALGQKHKTPFNLTNA